MPAIPLSAKEVLDRYFLETRCKLLEIAATLDRVDRADGGESILDDPRRQKVNQALELLKEDRGDRAEQLQLLFSREYDPEWIRDFEGAALLQGAR